MFSKYLKTTPKKHRINVSLRHENLRGVISCQFLRVTLLLWSFPSNQAQIFRAHGPTTKRESHGFILPTRNIFINTIIKFTSDLCTRKESISAMVMDNQ